MLFNSGVFLQFFAAFLLLYWLVRDHLRARNLLIVLASYLFYGWWDWRFLSLLLISSVLDYSVGLAISRNASANRRKAWLVLSLAGNLGILGFFKYYDFFTDSFAALLHRMQIPFHPATLGIILPVGISFYTFQTMSYTIDVYRGHMPATRSFLNFLAYVSFFPQLVAGPIERASHLLPQFERTRVITLSMVQEGVWLMLWGMFKKVVLADNLAPLVEIVYGATTYSAPVVLLGTLAFAFQIYCDFSGYSDIARGTARVLGFDIMMNFNIPYAAPNLREFWQRWHISLSTWLRDYLYIPLGGNRHGAFRTHFNLLVTMLLGGLWHGAAWNFVLWGAWHGLGLAAHRFFASTRRIRVSPSPIMPENHGMAVLTAAEPTALRSGGFQPASAPLAKSRGLDNTISTEASASVPPPVALIMKASPAKVFLGWVLTMAFVLYGWMLFRANSTQILPMTLGLASFVCPAWLKSFVVNLLLFTWPLIAMELWQARARNLLAPISLASPFRNFLQGLLLVAIIVFWEKDKVPFIYFQF